MEKLNMQTTDVVDENIKRIGELFPNCLTEVKDENGRPQVAIDFDQLRQELSKNIVEGPEERYQFTWPDKRNAIRLANAPTTDTLRPCREESVDFDNTQNLYIEGDNLQVLKLLRENYLGKVKMIYIDPPYNTGNDFVYNDNFDQDKQEYVHNSGQYDEQGNQLVTNTESNGRFHTDWLNMIYPRLKVAKDLLSEDGAVFVSINDQEVDNMKKILDLIYGRDNFVAQLIWANKEGGGGSDSKHFRIKHEYIIVYARNISYCVINGVEISNIERYTKSDAYVNTRGKYYLQQLGMGSLGYIASLDFPIVAPDGTEVYPNKDGRQINRWRWSCEKVEWGLKNDYIEFSKDRNGDWIVSTKQYLNADNEGNIIDRTNRPFALIEKYSSTSASKNLQILLKGRIFDYSKPVDLILFLLKTGSYKDSLILDFFSGSATTAHAVMQLNAEDGGKRKFIMVQLPEVTDEKSEAYKAGYKNICEIGKERIRRAAKKIKEETNADIDYGFRVLKLDSSNMENVYYTPAETTQQSFYDDNIKEGRGDEDLLFQSMIELGISLSAKIEKKEIAGKAVWSVEDNYLLACFDEEVNETTITEIAKQKPYYFIMRDSSLANDNVADNFEQIFEHYSKDTIRRIL
jgi:adenine-specific DNA-methyltransferase